MPDLSELFQRAAAELGPPHQPELGTLVAVRRRRDRVRTAGAVLGVAVLAATGALALPRAGSDRATAPADRTPVRSGYACLLTSGGTLGVGQEGTDQGRAVRCDSVPWTTATSPAADSTVLDVTVPSQGCDTDLSPAVRESSNSVEVAVLVLRTVVPGRQCAFRPPAVRFAQLLAPLAGRAVTHAPLGGGEPPGARGPSYSVSGRLEWVGGPVSLAAPTASREHPVPGLVLLDSGAGLAGSVTVGADGRFTVALPPGTYQLVGTSPSVNRSLAAFGQRAVTVADRDVDGVLVQAVVP
ncbi:MAG: hypothetical protein ACXVFU_15815 [Nocardioidaceae bacterium]